MVVNVNTVCVTAVCALTKDTTAAPRRILTRRSSNCSRKSFQSDLPKENRQRQTGRQTD